MTQLRRFFAFVDSHVVTDDDITSAYKIPAFRMSAQPLKLPTPLKAKKAQPTCGHCGENFNTLTMTGEIREAHPITYNVTVKERTEYDYSDDGIITERPVHGTRTYQVSHLCNLCWPMVMELGGIDYIMYFHRPYFETRKISEGNPEWNAIQSAALFGKEE